MKWAEMTAENRIEMFRRMRGAAQGQRDDAWVSLSPAEWAAIAEALTTLDALGPAFADVDAMEWHHDIDCRYWRYDTPADACDCAPGHVRALLAALRPLMPGVKP